MLFGSEEQRVFAFLATSSKKKLLTEHYILLTSLIQQILVRYFPYFMNYTEQQEPQHVEKLVTLQCVEGWTAKMLWEGIPLIDLIKKADPDDRVTNVIFKSTDGTQPV